VLYVVVCMLYVVVHVVCCRYVCCMCVVRMLYVVCCMLYLVIVDRGDAELVQPEEPGHVSVGQTFCAPSVR
jgi:hypothetical protein